MAEITEKELNDLFALANTELKEAEVFGGDIVVLALNELRNGTEHRGERLWDALNYLTWGETMGRS